MSAEGPTPTPPHSKDDDAADHARKHEEHRRHDERLDEGVEETFPASDPVAVKHIT
jgi:hypothetical protein